jgi:hypothetical protein
MVDVDVDEDEEGEDEHVIGRFLISFEYTGRCLSSLQAIQDYALRCRTSRRAACLVKRRE